MPPAITRVEARKRTGSMAENIARKIAEATQDGCELVEFALRVFRDQTMPFEDRKWAHEYLTDRGAGKAMAKLEVASSHTHTVRMNLTDYTFEELEEFERIQRRAEERKRIAQATDANVIEVKP